MVDSQPITCVLCSEEATPKVVKDSEYNAMMALLWEAMKIDVKFTENVKFDLCTSCFYRIASFYDLNDAAVIMEKRIKTLTKDLLKKNLEGITKLKARKRPTLPVHDMITEVYGDDGSEIEVQEIGNDNYDYEFEAQFLDTSGKKVRTSSESGGSKKSRAKSKERNGTADENRKTMVTVSDLLTEDETTDAMTTATTPSVTSSSRSGVKRGRLPARTRPGTRKAGKKKKKVLRKKQRLDSSEEDEEDVYSSPSESDVSNWSDDASFVPAVTEAAPTDDEKEKEIDDDDKTSPDEKDAGEGDSATSPVLILTKQKYECDICLEAYPNEEAYESHYSRHTLKPGQGFQCRVCREVFEKKEYLVHHLKLHSEGKYECPVCKVMCDKETKIIQHLQTSHKNHWNRIPQITTS